VPSDVCTGRRSEEEAAGITLSTAWL
jgi:hypothetical protein